MLLQGVRRVLSGWPKLVHVHKGLGVHFVKRNTDYLLQKDGDRENFRYVPTQRIVNSSNGVQVKPRLVFATSYDETLYMVDKDPFIIDIDAVRAVTKDGVPVYVMSRAILGVDNSKEICSDGINPIAKMHGYMRIATKQVIPNHTFALANYKNSSVTNGILKKCQTLSYGSGLAVKEVRLCDVIQEM